MVTESLVVYHTLFASVFSACPLIYLDGFTTPGKNVDREKDREIF